MIEQLVLYLQGIIAQYGAAGVLLATLAEEIIAPIPSPFIPLSAGFLMFPSSERLIQILPGVLWRIALPVTVGIGIGSSLVYMIGWWGGKPMVERFRRFLGFSWGDVERVEARLLSGPRDEVILFLLRILPIIPGVAISALCGIVRYPFRTYLVFTLAGTFVRATILGITGWWVGEAYTLYAERISAFEKPLLIGVILVVALLVLRAAWSRLRHRG